MRLRLHPVLVIAALCLCCAAPLRAQGQPLVEQQVNAERHLFPELGGGIRSVKVGSQGELFVLQPQRILIYDAKGAKIREILGTPPAGKSTPSISYGEAFDVDSSGRIYVADRGASMLRIFSAAGELSASVPVGAPTAVAALPGGEVAVASATSAGLISVYDADGKLERQFGELLDLADTPSLNLFLNAGRLASDASGNLYYAFTFAPEPTFRKYDRYGYAAYENSLRTLEFLGAAEAARKRISRRDAGETSELLQDVTALGVDRQAQTTFAAVGDLLLLFDKDGNLRSEYRLYTPDDARLEVNSIVVLPDKLIVASDVLGIYEFARVDLTAKQPKAEKADEKSHY